MCIRFGQVERGAWWEMRQLASPPGPESHCASLFLLVTMPSMVLSISRHPHAETPPSPLGRFWVVVEGQSILYNAVHHPLSVPSLPLTDIFSRFSSQ